MGSCCLIKSRKKISTSILANKVPFFRQSHTLSKEDIYLKYRLSKTIGKGTFSSVKEAVKINDETVKRIVKIIKKDSIKNNNTSFINELMILMELDHPNIVQFYEAYEDSKHFYIVMEYLAGQNLLDKIGGMPSYDENFVRTVLFQVLSAINYLHSVGVCHRDLKPANIILVSDDPDCFDIKVIDFGLSCKNEVEMEECLGTPYYVAPEVLTKKYSYECDIWSVGIIATVLFTGKPFFLSEEKEDLIKKIKSAPIDLTGDNWDVVSDPAKDLIRKMLCRNVNKRIMPAKALKHSFFDKTNETIHSSRKLDKSILKNIRLFSHHEKFKKLVIGCLIKTLPPEDLKRLDNAFNAIDLNHEGFIDLEELRKAFLKADIDVSEEEVSEMLKTLDSDGNGRLNYSEFLVAALNIKKYIKEKQLKQFFLSVDVSKDGYIDGKKVKAMLNRAGRRIQTKEIERMMSEVGDSEKRVQFDEFVNLFNNS